MNPQANDSKRIERLTEQLLDYGGRLESEWGDTPFASALHEAFELIAHADPLSSSRSAYLFDQEHRQKLSEALNGAILENLGYPRLSGLERIYRSTEICIDEMVRAETGSGAFLSLESL